MPCPTVRVVGCVGGRGITIWEWSRGRRTTATNARSPHLSNTGSARSLGDDRENWTASGVPDFSTALPIAAGFLLSFQRRSGWTSGHFGHLLKRDVQTWDFMDKTERCPEMSKIVQNVRSAASMRLIGHPEQIAGCLPRAAEVA